MITAPFQPPPAVPALHQELQVPNADACDVGVVSLLDVAPAARRIFTLRALSGPVVVTRLSPSCHCVSAALSAAGEAASLPRVFAPGRTLSVAVSIDLAELRPGPFTKTVVVYAKPSTGGAEFVLTRLAVRGTLLPAVSFAAGSSVSAAPSLSVLPLGTLDLAAPRSTAGGVVLVATPDPRLLRGNAAVPPLASAVPGVRTERLPDAKNGALRYRVSAAPDAPVGPVFGMLSFAPSVSDKSVRAAAWRSAGIVVTGEIVGDIAASPRVVAFSLAPGAGATSAPGLAASKAGDTPPPSLSRAVTLTARVAACFVGITAECDKPAVSARLLPPATGASATATERTLLITLAPDAARRVAAADGGGFFQARVTVRLANGQRLALPVSAFLEQRLAPAAPAPAKQEVKPAAPKR